MQIIIGVLLLCTFLGMIIYSLKGGNLMLGILVMAILWTFLPLLGNRLVTDPAFIEANQELIETPIMTALTKIFQTSPENWGKVLVTFIFGAWFGRVMLDTGIASSIIRKTVELGGDKPGLTAMLLYIVTAAIFSSMFGAGAVVAIGIIVLPILLSLGVPKILALVSFMFSVGAGFYINPVGFAQYQVYYLDGAGNNTVFYDSAYLRWGFTALGIQLVIAILITLILMRKMVGPVIHPGGTHRCAGHCPDYSLPSTDPDYCVQDADSAFLPAFVLLCNVHLQENEDIPEYSKHVCQNLL